MVAVMVVSIIIIFAVIFLTVITTNKAYGFKHTIDPIDPEPMEHEEPIDKERNN